MATAESTITTSEELLDTIKHNNHHRKKKQKARTMGMDCQYITPHTSHFTGHRKFSIDLVSRL